MPNQSLWDKERTTDGEPQDSARGLTSPLWVEERMADPSPGKRFRLGRRASMGVNG